MRKNRLMTIGEVLDELKYAGFLRVTHGTLHRWETEERLVPAAKRVSGVRARVYSSEALRRMKAIALFKSAGIPTITIRAFFGSRGAMRRVYKQELTRLCKQMGDVIGQAEEIIRNV